MERRLYRSRRERMLAGVAGGLGEYLGIDPVIVRLAFVVLTLATGWGLLLYVILMLVIPEEPLGMRLEAGSGEPTVESRYHRLTAQERGMLIGGALVALGLLMLANQFGLWWRLGGRFLWPLLLIAAGVALLINRARS